MSRMPRRARDGEAFDVEAGARMRRFFDRLRSDLDLETDAEMWRYLRVSRDAAQAWMRGERPPSRDSGQRVAEKAGIQYGDLLAIYNGEEREINPAAVIQALEWAITQVRSGEWSPTREVRTTQVPAEYRVAADRLAGRTTKSRPTRR